MNKFSGKAWCYGDHIDTDMIIPGKFLVSYDEKELGQYAFYDTNKDFAKLISPGDILVAGRNFGCGSSREHAPAAIRGAGISCIIAESYARTFFRNCINRGFFAIELPGISQQIKNGDTVTVDINGGFIKNESSNKCFNFIPFPEFVLTMCKSGGLLKYIEQQLESVN